MVGGVPHPRQGDGGCKEEEKVTGVNQLWAPTRYEKWKVCAGVQADFENDRSIKMVLIMLGKVYKIRLIGITFSVEKFNQC